MEITIGPETRDLLYIVLRKLDAIQLKLNLINKKENIEMADLTKLTSDVAANRSAVDSAVTLLKGLKDALDAAGTDPVALAALSASLETETSDLAAAVVANTPVAPTP